MLVEKALIPSNSTATIAATGEEHNSESLEDVSDDSVLIPLQDQQALCGVCKQQAGMARVLGCKQHKCQEASG